MLGALLPRARHPARRPDAVGQDDRRRRRCVQHLLLRDRLGQARAAPRLHRPRADGDRRGAHRHVPPALSPRAAHLGQGGRRQQLRARPLHGRQGDHRPRARPHPQARGQLHGPAGLPRVQCRWRWHGLGSLLAAPRAPLRRLRPQVEADVHDLPVAADLDRRRRAVQHGALDALAARALGRVVHGRQRGPLRHLPPQPRHRAPDLYEPQPARRADHLGPHRVAPLRRRAQRRPDRVPDQPGAVPAHPLRPLLLRTHHFRREGLPRAAVRRRDNERRL
mmetsp:Transcript_18076/g.56318  ORF Transcript_18076/g.56318 Transcript_18076/m.56318 type:complete len:278 (-) Transcript_18076:1387-2220(-)